MSNVEVEVVGNMTPPIGGGGYIKAFLTRALPAKEPRHVVAGLNTKATPPTDIRLRSVHGWCEITKKKPLTVQWANNPQHRTGG